MITQLIDKQDNFEIVRDQIAAILATEVENQKVLATNAGKDPSLWDMQVYLERSDPWEKWINEPDNEVPIVSVEYDKKNVQPSASGRVAQQKYTVQYHIDCYGSAISKDTVGGHRPGDLGAALNAQRANRLCRNILMAGEYTYLGLRGIVWGRMITVDEAYQVVQAVQKASYGMQKAHHIIANRLTLVVDVHETAPQVEGTELELVINQVGRAADGQLIVATSYDYT